MVTGIDFTKPVRLSKAQFTDFINDVKQNYESVFTDNKIFFTKHNEDVFYIRIPKIISPDFISPLLKKDKYFYPENDLFFSVILVKSGDASLGVFENEKLVLHKVIKKYMVRKKQGKSQISYLNEKGKSRLGSRIRLMQAKEFFKEIDEKMLLWGDYLKKSEKVFISAPVALKNFLFKSNDEVRKLLGDIDLKPLSFSVKTPCHKELIRSGYILESAYLNVLTKDEEEKEFLYKSLYDLLF